MSRRTAGRALTVALVAAAGLMTAGTAAAGTEGQIGFAATGLDGTDPRTGRTLHSGFEVYAPAGVQPFGRTDVFVGGILPDGGEGILYECTTEESVRARMDGLDSASATGTLPVTCSSPEGLPDRRGHVVVALNWRGTGTSDSYVLPREDGCTEYLDVRPARVTGRLVLVVPGVAVAPLVNTDAAENTLRQQRIVC